VKDINSIKFQQSKQSESHRHDWSRAESSQWLPRYCWTTEADRRVGPEEGENLCQLQLTRAPSQPRSLGYHVRTGAFIIIILPYILES